MPDLDRLLDDFAARLARGERPDARAYVARAGSEGPELTELIDRLLLAAPPAPADEESVALMQAWADGEPPLLELRRRRGRRRDAVVEAIMIALALAPATRARVAGHYHRLESGLLDPARVDRRVMAAIATAMGATLDELGKWAVRRPPPLASARLMRGPAFEVRGAPSARLESRIEPEEWDEVDRLFGVGA